MPVPPQASEQSAATVPALRATRRFALVVDAAGNDIPACLSATRQELTRIAGLSDSELEKLLKHRGFVHPGGIIRPCPALEGMHVLEETSYLDAWLPEPGIPQTKPVYIALSGVAVLPRMDLRHTLINERWDDLFKLPADSLVWYKERWLTLPELREVLRNQ